MKSIINTLLIVCAVVAVLVMMGVISEKDILDMLGKVEMGETTQSYKEGEFKKRFDLIVGSVEVDDTSKTEFKRNIPLCEPAYVSHITKVNVEYRVNTTPETFYFDGKKKEYYFAPELGVSYTETDRKSEMATTESFCVKKRDITVDDIDKTRRTAELQLKKAIEGSEKIKAAIAEFERVKGSMIKEFEAAGFVEAFPPENDSKKLMDN